MSARASTPPERTSGRPATPPTRRESRRGTPPALKRGSVLKGRGAAAATAAARNLENDIICEEVEEDTEKDVVEVLLVELAALQVRLAEAHDRQVNELRGEIMRLKETMNSKGASDRTAGSTPPPITSKARDSLMFGTGVGGSNFAQLLQVNGGRSPRSSMSRSSITGHRSSVKQHRGSFNGLLPASQQQQPAPSMNKSSPVPSMNRANSMPIGPQSQGSESGKRPVVPDRIAEVKEETDDKPTPVPEASNGVCQKLRKSHSTPLHESAESVGLKLSINDKPTPPTEPVPLLRPELNDTNASSGCTNFEAWGMAADNKEIKEEEEDMTSSSSQASSKNEADMEVARVLCTSGRQNPVADDTQVAAHSSEKPSENDSKAGSTSSTLRRTSGISCEELPQKDSMDSAEESNSNDGSNSSDEVEHTAPATSNSAISLPGNLKNSHSAMSYSANLVSSSEVITSDDEDSDADDVVAERGEGDSDGWVHSPTGKMRQVAGSMRLPSCIEDDEHNLLRHSHMSDVGELPEAGTFQIGRPRQSVSAGGRLSVWSNFSEQDNGGACRMSLTLPSQNDDSTGSFAPSMSRTSVVSGMNSRMSMRSNGSRRASVRPASVRFSTMPKAGENLQPWDCWLEIVDCMEDRGDTHHYKSNRRRAQTIDHEMQLRLQSKSSQFHRMAAEETRWGKCLQACVVTPNHPLRVCWVIASMILICWDVVMIPMGVYELNMDQVIEVMTYTSASFWTTDFIMSFFVGFHDQFTLEMRFRLTCKHYIRTWMALDLSLVAIDWCVITAEQVIGGQFRTMRAAKTVYAMRTYRALRLLRIAKLPMQMKEFSILVGRSEYTSLLAGIVKHMSLILLINHLIACTWYLLGKGSDSGWVATYLSDGDPWVMCYLTSLHWSLTQFTPATMSVQPQNLAERAMAVGVLLFAMVSFSSFVSSITNLMNHLRSLKSLEAKAFMKLERYLHDHHISFHLSLKVRRYLDNVIAVQRRNVSEKDVELIARLSDPLRMELHYEVYSHSILRHPFFKHYESTNLTAMQKLCHSAVKAIRLSRDDVLFSNGESAKASYFLTSGTLNYTRHSQSMDLEEEVECGRWVCEMVLWTPWEHRGNMRASTESNVTSLDADIFHEVVLDNKHGAVDTANYAIQAVAKMNECFKHPSDYSDLDGFGYDPHQMCDELFNGGGVMSGRQSNKSGWIRRMTSSITDRHSGRNSDRAKSPPPELFGPAEGDDSEECGELRPRRSISSDDSGPKLPQRPSISLHCTTSGKKASVVF